MRALALIGLMAAAWNCLPAPASAQDTNVTDCLNSDDVARKFATCDELLKAGFSTDEATALVTRERGRANVAQGHFDAGLSDYTQAITLAPNKWETYYYRARLYARFTRHELAISDFERLLALYQARGPGTAEERQPLITQVETALAPLRADLALETHWQHYLADIQARNAYPNWSAPPLDLHLKQASAPLEGE